MCYFKAKHKFFSIYFLIKLFSTKSYPQNLQIIAFALIISAHLGHSFSSGVFFIGSSIVSEEASSTLLSDIHFFYL